MCKYASIRYQVNRDIENASQTSELSSQEIKRKLIEDWNKEVYDIGRVSNMEIKTQRGDRDGKDSIR